MSDARLAGYVAQAVRDEVDAGERLDAALAAGHVNAAHEALEDQIDARAFLRGVLAMIDAPKETMH